MSITNVFAHHGIIGIQSAVDSDGLLNNPLQAGQLGFVMDAATVQFSEEALALLEKVRRSGDDIGDVDVFKTNDNKTIFCWLGGPLRMIDPLQCEGSRTYDAKLLRSAGKIVPNDPPKDFTDAVDRILAASKKSKKL